MADPTLYFLTSLRARLLLLTILFVSVIEAVIYFPAVATFRQNFLEERLTAAQVAGLALEEAPDRMVSEMLEMELMDTAGVISVVLLREDTSLILGLDEVPLDSNTVYDLRKKALFPMILDSLETLDARGQRISRIIGTPLASGTRYVEVFIDERALYEGMAAFSNNMLVISLIISVFTGLLTYLALHFMIVRPLRRIKGRITTFRRAPEAWTPPTRRSRRRDEVGLIDREFTRMQEEIRQSLKQKTRLAELGEAVAKINHDLRNILATTTLASEALSRVEHPRVQRISGRLINAVNRAVALCERTLQHGRADEPEPDRRTVVLRELVDEVLGTLGLLGSKGDIETEIAIDPDLRMDADPDQFHRVLMNLCRNAIDAQGLSGKIAVAADKDADGTVRIRVSDWGPGIPDAVLPNLFKPFTSSGKGGTGLGLAISRDIVLAHGGKIGLERTGPEGTSFIITLPAGGAP